MIEEMVEHPQDKLTEWSNEPSLVHFKNDFAFAKPAHDVAVAAIDLARDLLHNTGSAKAKVKKGRSSVQSKLIRKNAEWQYASLANPFLSTEDLFDIYPTTFEDGPAAEQNSLLLNYQFNNKLNKVKLVNDVIHDAVDNGVVFVKAGWKTVTRNVEEEVPVYEYYDPSPAMLDQLNQAAQLQASNPEYFNSVAPDEIIESLRYSKLVGRPYEARVASIDTVTKEVNIVNCPEAIVVNYANLYIGPSKDGTLENAEFTIYSFETSLAELKAEGGYKNLDKINSESDTVLSDTDHRPLDMLADGSNFKPKDPRKKLIAYEYWGNWDIYNDGNLYPIKAVWVDDILIQLIENPMPDGKHPYVSACTNHKTNSIYGEADAHILEDNQQISGAVMRGMIDLMGRSANAQRGIRADALDIVNQRKFENGEDYQIRPTVQDIRSVLHMHQYPEIPAAAFNMLQLQQNEAESLSGVKAFSSALSGNSLGESATGIRGVLDATSKREANIQQRIADLFIALGRKFIAMNAEFLEEEEVVRVTNSQFVKIRRDDLAGEFDLRLTISTAEADNEKAQELSFMLQTIGPNMDPSITKLILADICKLRKMPVLAKKVEQWEPQPDPLAQRKAMLENLLLEAQIQAAQVNAGKVMSDTELARAKAISEQAKALNLKADTDLKNLEFVEQESGVHQERELEKLREQAKGNAAYKLMEHALNNPTGNAGGNEESKQ